MLPSEFVRCLFGNESGYIALWRSDTKLTRWVENKPDLTEIDDAAFASRSTAHDLYFGCSLQGQPSAGRGTATTCTVVPGLWADIDYAEKPDQTEAARKKNYPPRAVAERVIDSMPGKPSLIVETGGGIHAYWLFDEPYRIDDGEERTRIAALVRSWQGLIKTRLIKAGMYGIDSTHDLSRVLRLPDTVNTKYGNFPVEVKVDRSQLRYSIPSIEAWVFAGTPLIPATPAATTSPIQKEVVEIRAKAIETAIQATSRSGINGINADAEPPGSKLYNLINASGEFKKLWDGKAVKASPSEYDMSLANYAINAGWSDNEAASLLVAFARQHQPSHLDKLLRVSGGIQDYLTLTVGKAHDKRQSTKAAEQTEAAIDELAIEVRESQREGRPVERRIILENVSKALGVNVIGFRQVGRRNEVYSLLCRIDKQPREIVMGSASEIHSSPSRFLERIMSELGHYIPVTPKIKKEWPAIIGGLVSICEFHDLIEMEISSCVQLIVDEHLKRRSGGLWVTSESQRVLAASNGDPFIESDDDGQRLYLFGPNIRKLAAEVDKSLTATSVYIGLKALGFVQSTVSTRGTSRSYWVGRTDGFQIASQPDMRPMPGSVARATTGAE